jgi:hypothetical protein
MTLSRADLESAWVLLARREFSIGLEGILEKAKNCKICPTHTLERGNAPSLRNVGFAKRLCLDIPINRDAVLSFSRNQYVLFLLGGTESLYEFSVAHAMVLSHILIELPL